MVIRRNQLKPILARHLDYHVINLAIFLTVVSLCLYVELGLTMVSCPYAELGLKCHTCGLTTAFQGLLNGQTAHATFNSVFLFVVIVGQIVIRPLISSLLILTSQFVWIRNIDIIMSILLVLVMAIILL